MTDSLSLLSPCFFFFLVSFEKFSIVIKNITEEIKKEFKYVKLM